MKLKELEEQLVAVDGELTAAENEPEAQAKVAMLTRELDQRRETIARRRSDLEAVQHRIDEVPLRVDQARAYRDELSVSLARIEAAQADDVVGLSQLREIDEALDSLDWLLANADAKQKALTRRLTPFKRALKQAEAEAAPVESELDGLKTQLRAAERAREVAEDSRWG